MTINCPHCSRDFDVNDDVSGRYSCSLCSGSIMFEKAAVPPPLPKEPKKRGWLRGWLKPVLLAGASVVAICVLGFVVMVLIGATEHAERARLLYDQEAAGIVSTDPPGTVSDVPKRELWMHNSAKEGKAAIGMFAPYVRRAWGSPKRVNTTKTANGDHAQWVYDDNYVYFEDGIVTSISTSR